MRIRIDSLIIGKDAELDVARMLGLVKGSVILNYMKKKLKSY